MSAPDFAAWFAAQGFRNFAAREFTDYFAASRKGVRNHTPPRSLWPNIVPPDITIREMELDDLAPVYHLGERLFTCDLYPFLYHRVLLVHQGYQPEHSEGDL